MPTPETLKSDLNSPVVAPANPTAPASVTPPSTAAPKPAVSAPSAPTAATFIAPKPEPMETLFSWLLANCGSIRYQRDQNLFVLQNARHQEVALSANDLMDNPVSIPSKLRDAYAAL